MYSFFPIRFLCPEVNMLHFFLKRISSTVLTCSVNQEMFCSTYFKSEVSNKITIIIKIIDQWVLNLFRKLTPGENQKKATDHLVPEIQNYKISDGHGLPKAPFKVKISCSEAKYLKANSLQNTKDEVIVSNI